MSDIRRLARRRSRPALSVPWLLAGAMLLWPGPAGADHSLGNSCISCHNLRSTRVVPGSRNLDCEIVSLAQPLYGWTWTGSACQQATSIWYCGGSWSPGAAPDGDPIDCSYCHGSAGDIADEMKVAATTDGSRHPVSVGADGGTVPANRITCNDCHNADVKSDPTDPCSKLAGRTAGYPNHQSVQGSTPVGSDPGTNQRIGTAAHLELGTAYKYGLDVDWSGDLTSSGNTPFCFRCHDTAIDTTPDIQALYTAARGGHNLTGVGSAALDGRKLPCFDCHDPHASANKELIIDGVDSPRNPYQTTFLSSDAAPTGYDGTNDRVVCTTCHGGYSYDADGAGTGSAITLTSVLTAFSPRFPYHANAHDGLSTAGNCLQKNGGCHLDVHNTDIFRCQDCHDTARSDPNANARLRDPADAGFVGNPGDEFAGAGMASRHDIVYATDPALDMSQAANNGCLECHDVPAGTTLASRTPLLYQGGTAYGRPTGGWGIRADLQDYDAFCLSCHDGSWVAFGAYPAPNVGLYFDTAGHGKPDLSGSANTFVPCLECHVYHGSTAYKLLPGATLVGNARDVKGYAYARGTTGSRFPIGDNTDSRKIDYTDYTDNANNSRITSANPASEYYSDYQFNWSTYGDNGDEPSTSNATLTEFGTSGDVRPNTSSGVELGCDQDATDASATGSPKVGFCNACHLYSDADDGTTATYGRIYTHEGQSGGSGGGSGATCGSNPLDSQKNFFKDCAECHDPHGSGTGTSGQTNEHLSMIRGKIQVEPGTWNKQVDFRSRGGTQTEGDNSYDEDDIGAGEANADDLCTVCHVTDPAPADPDRPGVDHNYESYTGAPDHYQGDGCATCHGHGWGTQTTNREWIGFKRARCDECHGAPPTTADAYPDNPGAVGAHDPHAVTMSYPCRQCHWNVPHNESGWAGNPGTTIPTANVEVAFDTAVNPSGSYNTSGDTCSTLYCHSDGRAKKSGTATTTTYTPIIWTSGNPGCEGCHGNAAVHPTTSYQYGAPDYANGGTSTQDANSHTTHVNGAIPCSACHTTTIADSDPGDGWTLADGGPHDNGAIDVVLADAYDQTPSVKTDDYVGSTKTCSNVVCHLGNTVQWGQQDSTAVTCQTCHLVSAADLDDYAWNNFGGTAAAVSQDEWQFSGHGRRTGSYDVSTNGAAAFYDGARTSDAEGCAYCHGLLGTAENPSTGHGDTSNPFRLINRSGTQTDENGYGWNNVCLVCHTTGDSGYDPDGTGAEYGQKNSGRNVDEDHFGTKHAGGEGGQFCWDCHDPHGDRSSTPAGNIFMAHRVLSKANDDAYGVPVTTVTVNFTTKSLPVGVGYYVELTNNPATGICQACHEDKTGFTDETRFWRSNRTEDANGDGASETPASRHQEATVCTQCHRHEKRFKARCDSCHGFPPIASSLTPVARTATPGERVATDPTGYAEGGGVHRTHVNLFWKKFDPAFDPTDPASVPTVEPDPRVLCGPCHGDNPGSTTWHDEGADGITVSRGNVDIRTRDITGFSWGSGAYYQTSTHSMSGPNAGGHVSTSSSTQLCANLDCHGKADPDLATDGRAHTPEELSWQDTVSVTTDGTGQYQVSKRTAVCKWCHDGTPAQVVLKDGPGTGNLYDSGPAMGATGVYFKPPSGFSRGGHGDGNINPTDDPSWGQQPEIESSLDAPIDCVSCHDDTLAVWDETTGDFPGMRHLPPYSTGSGANQNHHRLTTFGAANPVNALCTSANCHAAADDQDGGSGLPLYHHRTNWEMHRAFNEPSGVNYDVPDQGDVDEFVQYWSSPPPYTSIGSPSQVDLPFDEDLWVGSSLMPTGGTIVCTTCHQPHGADLAVDTAGMAGGNYEQIPDNDMLRLRYEAGGGDETLCEACHKR